MIGNVVNEPTFFMIRPVDADATIKGKCFANKDTNLPIRTKL